jgi:hypothetical protein
VRAESGNAISRENPSLVEGAAGGSGWVNSGWVPRDNFVSVPIAKVVTTGRFQVRRDPRMVLLAPIGRIVGLRNNQVTSLLWAQVPHGKTRRSELVMGENRYVFSPTAAACIGYPPW